MINLRKTLVAPLLLLTLMLSGCGSVLQNEKEVDGQAFVTAVAKTKANTYDTCVEKGYSLLDSKKDEYDVTLEWKILGWVAPTGVAYTPVLSVVTSLPLVVSTISGFGAVNNIKYYTGDNGYRIACDYSGEYTSEGRTANITLKVDYVWNECGYPLKEYLKMSGTSQGESSVMETNMSYTYSNSK